MLSYTQDALPRKAFIPMCAALLFASVSCLHKTIAPAASTPAAGNSYIDLAPGGSLRIVVPLLKPGALAAGMQSVQRDGNTFLVSAANLAGYYVSVYAIERAPHGRVRLRFTSAETTRDGKTLPGSQPPALPFALPMTAQHIRLIYLVRKSQSDHNMAVVASKSVDALDAFTEQFLGHPDVCRTDREISCSWVPTGIAVRPETQPPPKP